LSVGHRVGRTSELVFLGKQIYEALAEGSKGE
jgi:hypothetical protein